MIVRVAVEPDLGKIAQLDAAAFEPGEIWTQESWRHEVSGTRRTVLVAVTEDRVIGAASYEVTDDVADLRRIMVAPEVRGKAIASKLIRGGIEWAQAGGAQRILLEVAEDNLSALRLYERTGFEQISLRRNYYPAGQDAVIMSLELEDR